MWIKISTYKTIPKHPTTISHRLPRYNSVWHCLTTLSSIQENAKLWKWIFFLLCYRLLVFKSLGALIEELVPFELWKYFMKTWFTFYDLKRSCIQASPYLTYVVLKLSFSLRQLESNKDCQRQYQGGKQLAATIFWFS